MPETALERSPCPFCAQPAAVEALRCPHCRGLLALDVVICAAVADERRRYRLARVLAALGPPLPGLSALRDALAADHGVLARGLSRGAAERLIATLRDDHGIEAVAHQAASQGGGRGLAAPPPLPPARRSSGRTIGLAVTGLAVLATMGVVAVRWAASAMSAGPLSPAALQAVADDVRGSRGLVEGKNLSGSGVFVGPGLLLARATLRGAVSSAVYSGDRQQAAATVVQADAEHGLVLVRVAGTQADPLAMADAAAVRDGDALIVVERQPGTGAALAKNAVVTNAAATRGSTSMIQLEVTLGDDPQGAPVVDRRRRVVGLIAASDPAARQAWVVPVNYAFAWLPAVPHDETAWARRTAAPEQAVAARDHAFAGALQGPVLVSARHGGIVSFGPQREILSERFLMLVVAPAASRPSGPLRVRIGPCDVDASVSWLVPFAHPLALAAFDRWAEAQGVRDLIAAGEARATIERKNCVPEGVREVALLSGDQAAEPVPLEIP